MHNQEEWTTQLVAEHYLEAVSTLRKLPPVAVQGYFKSWPSITHTPNELMLMEQRPARFKATPDAISRLEQALEWMQWLTVLERKLVWKRAAKISWKTICYELACSQSTAQRKWTYGLKKICNKLNMC